ncbi:MAG: hypothetical protein H7Z41_12755 [Cytophagales bacterium]|nr:hypothetical protein [Armatimonadota bacterium]
MPRQPMHLLVNLPPGFFSASQLVPTFARLDTLAETVTKTSCNNAVEILPYLREADAVLMWSWPKLTPALLDQCPRLGFSANLDISQQGARVLLERGIPVSVSRRGFSPAVAEMALTLLLATLRRTSGYHAALWAGTETWVSRFPEEIPAEERQLTGRRVGIIGFGAIGQRLAELLVPFHCEIAVHDPFLPDGVAERFGVRNGSVDDLVRHSEALVVCAAANAGTRHVLEAGHLEALLPGTVLVNVSRAALVDSDALLARLQRGDLFAALDVFDQEPLPADSPLRVLPNVYLTPHRAGGIWESVVRIVDYLADDLQAFAQGKELRHALAESQISSLDA